MIQRRLAPFLALLLLAGCASGPAQEPQARQGDHAHGDHAHGDHAHGDHATVTHRFADAERWAKRFEDPARDAWQQPDHVLAHLALRPDAKVVDIGAATGYFPVRFAKVVPQGRVYGVDVEPTLVNYLNLRAQRADDVGRAAASRGHAGVRR